jgi:hypothetical protein
MRSFLFKKQKVISIITNVMVRRIFIMKFIYLIDKNSFKHDIKSDSGFSIGHT